MDKIYLKNLRAHCIIGVYDREREQPQEILVDITLFTDTRHAAETDDIADCVDYDLLAQNVRALAETSSRFTIEALAEDISNLCLNQPGVRKARVTVRKPGAILFADSAGVEIERKR